MQIWGFFLQCQVGGSGQGRDATYGLPPNWDWNIPPPQPPQAHGVDPVLAGLMQQQLQLGQTLIDVMRRGNQPQQPQQPQQVLRFWGSRF